MRSLREVYLWRLIRALNSLEINSLRATRDIRVAADVSLALTAPKGSIWSRALLANISKHEKNRDILQKIAGKKKYMRALQRNHELPLYMCLGSVLPKSRESVVEKSRLIRRSALTHRKLASTVHISPSRIARKIVQKRTKILQSLVPGGRSMDISCLLKETADYIISLKAQVQVMEFLADAATN